MVFIAIGSSPKRPTEQQAHFEGRIRKYDLDEDGEKQSASELGWQPLGERVTRSRTNPIQRNKEPASAITSAWHRSR